MDYRNLLLKEMEKDKYKEQMYNDVLFYNIYSSIRYNKLEAEKIIGLLSEICNISKEYSNELKQYKLLYGELK